MVISVYFNTGEYEWIVVNDWTCKSIHPRPIPLVTESTRYVFLLHDHVKLRNRNFVTCTLFSLLWYEIKDVPIYRCKSFKFRTLGVKFRYIYCS